MLENYIFDGTLLSGGGRGIVQQGQVPYLESGPCIRPAQEEKKNLSRFFFFLSTGCGLCRIWMIQGHA